MNHYSVIIVGGGQAGLSLSYYLKKNAINHLILDRGEIGNSWVQNRWDNFCLVTPNWQCRLPDYHYNGNDADGFMVKDEMINYIKGYANTFNPPFEGNVNVTKVYKEKLGDIFYLETSNGKYSADIVVSAIGGYHTPNIPQDFSKAFNKSIVQINSIDYKNAQLLPEGNVLVIGTGQSGVQIAQDLHMSGKKVYLSVGSAPRAPRRHRGKDIVYWLELMGHYNKPVGEQENPDELRRKPNNYLTGRDGGQDVDLRKFAMEGMKLHGRISSIDNGIISFQNDLKQNLDNADLAYERIQKTLDEYIDSNNIKAPKYDRYNQLWEPTENNETALDYNEAGITSVVWCTGFKLDFKWIDFPHLFNSDDYPTHDRGVTNEQGLYFIGLPWLYTYGSGGLSYVGQDAEYICNHIIKRLY
ncbi:MSMEG_0569 family flavin-dependent oxidoreductase [Flavobacterium undicola]|uniref:MSMEG_0569 family flavin-dependent oxidoreductase n=1 Tax=Flavobacterium undicola TaxID=1932779 RepID=UPI0013769D51|nr:MSMEG_0569 family flavin-dependent oxidoreductase [Flavobacterium undicola]